MKAREARALGKRVAMQICDVEIEQAYTQLAPVLAKRTSFAKLGLIGEAVGAAGLEEVNAFLDRIAAEKTEGGWVVIGKTLSQQLDRDLAGTFARCRRYTLTGDVWYCTDILAERVPGPALVTHFQSALECLRPWHEDDDAWVRRAVGVAVHFWAKRSHGADQRRPQAEVLLSLMAPMFEEWEIDAAKGVGWGLKTLGKHYPNLVADWLAKEVVPGERRHRAVMLHKALTYLSEEQRARATGKAP